MPGGGYIFDCNGSIDIAKEENIDAMYNALLKYGSYKQSKLFRNTKKAGA